MLLSTGLCSAQCTSDDVLIEVISAYKLIDDSKVQTPSGVNVQGAKKGNSFRSIEDC